MVDQLSVLSQVRPRDVAVLAAFLAAVFIFRAPDIYELKAAWRLDLHKSNGSHHRNLLPKPIISDLESDGTNELVIASADAKITILTFPVEHLGSGTILPHLHVKAEYSLASDSSDTSILPVALATGCQEHSSEDDCHQIIVVVTSDWMVHCFNNFLKPLWKTKVHTRNQPLSAEHFKEVAAAVFSQHNGGLVVVGGRASESHHKAESFGHDHTLKVAPAKTAEELANGPRVPRPVGINKAPGEAAHFSTYALDSRTGHIQWRHEPGDFEPNRTARENLLTAYHFKLALQSNSHHADEVHWNQYRASILRTLPLRWTHPSDTDLTTAHFRKGITGSASSVKPGAKDTNWFGLGSLNFDSTADGGNERKNKSEDNAMVIRSHQGLEVLNLQSGQPMCRYVLAQEGTTVGDLNGDDVIDHVRSHFSAHQDVASKLPSCSAVVTSESSVVFTGPICSSNSMFGGYFDLTEDREHDQEPFSVPPLLLRSAPHRTGIFRHLMGHNLRERSRKGMDAVFLVSTGKLTSYGPHGEQNWQVAVDGVWKRRAWQDVRGQWSIETGSDDAHFFPSIQGVRIQADEEESAVLVSGWGHISLVALVDGAIMASHTLPCQPVAPVVRGDFTNDGLTDFVVQCSQSCLGFSLDRRPGYLWTAVWVVCGLLVTLMALGIMRFVEEELL